MNLFRLLTILALMPLTAWSGMPHVACRCSNGEIHLACPRLNQAKVVSDTASSNICQKATNAITHRSCCGGAKVSKCCGSSTGESSDQGAGCCADGCRCTPVLLQADVGTTLKKVCLPELTSLDLANLSLPVIRETRSTPVELSVFDAGPRAPIDIVVLYERWLI